LFTKCHLAHNKCLASVHVTLGKAFVQCFCNFVVCFRHSAKVVFSVGSHRGRRMKGYEKPSIDVKMKEEQQVIDWKN
jgi:hypothetical protein